MGMDGLRSFPTSLRVNRHFLERLHERFPRVDLTEGQLAQELEGAGWYPAGGRAFYVLQKFGDELAVIVVEVREGLLDLLTVYPPNRNWDLRLRGLRPWPFALVAALGA